MAQSTDKKRQARNLYVFKRMNQTMIGLELSVSATTVRRWRNTAKKNGDDWDKARSANMLAGDGINSAVAMVVEEFVILAQGLVEELKMSNDSNLDLRIKQITSLSDAMNKMVNSASRLAPKISELGVAQDVIKRLLIFVKDEFPHHGDAIQEILEPFGDHLARAYE